MKAVIWNDLTEKEQTELLMRPAVLARAFNAACGSGRG